MKKATIFLISFIMLFASVQPVGVVKLVKGKIDLLRVDKTQWIPTKMGEVLYSGDVLKTSENSRAAILFIDNTQLKINENTSIVLQSEKTGVKNLETSISMAIGEIFAVVTKQKSNFQVITPTSVASVKGTTFDLLVSDDGFTTLLVLEGSVELANEMGKMLANAMEKTSSTVGAAPTEKIVISKEEIPTWEQKIEPDWNLKFQPTGEIQKDNPFNVKMNVLNQETGEMAQKFRGKVDITANSPSVQFSDDGGQTWKSDLGIKVVGGQTTFKVKAIAPGKFSIFATAENCGAAAENFSVVRTATQKAQIVEKVLQILSENGFDFQIGEKEMTDALLKKGEGSVEQILELIQSNDGKVEIKITENEDGSVDVILINNPEPEDE